MSTVYGKNKKSTFGERTKVGKINQGEGLDRKKHYRLKYRMVDSGPMHKSASGFGVVFRAITITQQKSTIG